MLISLIKFPIILFLIFSTAYTNIFHGVALQMTSDGTGFYYKPGVILMKHSKLLGTFGIHSDNNFQNVSRFDVENRNRSIYLDLAAEFKQELLEGMIAGAFRPIFTFQGGSIVDIGTISRKNNLGNWKLKYAIGAGFQFYNVRTLNELTLKYNNNPFTKGNMAIQFAIYWE